MMYLQNERADFSHALRDRKLACVSEQKIKELYPNENDQTKIFKQCHNFGVRIFDASDADKIESAMNEQQEYKALCGEIVRSF